LWVSFRLKISGVNALDIDKGPLVGVAVMNDEFVVRCAGELGSIAERNGHEWLLDSSLHNVNFAPSISIPHAHLGANKIADGDVASLCQDVCLRSDAQVG
jgi:hypothetical protein